MNVLHLDSGREMRGGQWQALRLMRGLRTLGHTVRILTASRSPLGKRCGDERFECGVLGCATVRTWSPNADIIHAHDARSHTYAAVCGRAPLVVSRRVVFPVRRGMMSRWKYRKPALFLAVSEAVAGQLIAAGIQRDRVRVIYDGVPLLPDLRDARGPVIIPRSTDARKLTELAVQACGRAGAPVLRSRHLQQDLSGAGLLLYLTESEGLGSAALLALSAGVPVIASNLGGLREAVNHGVTGLLVENNIDAASTAVRRLRNDLELSARISAAARASAQEKFGEQRMVAETLEAYRSVIV